MSVPTAGFFRSAWLCTVLVQNTFDEYLEFRQLKKNAGTKIPEEVKGVVDQETFVKSQSYNYDKRLFGMLASVLEMVFDVWMTLKVTGSIFAWTGTIVSPENEYMRTIIWFILGSLIGDVIAIPISAYRTFVIEQRHGFNRMTVKLFITDLVKSELISMVFVFLLVPPVIYLIRWGGEYFYVYVWAFCQVVVVVMMFVYPALIQPLFNKYEPLHDLQLREKIEALADSHKFPLTKLFQVDGSKRSSHSNAYFFGFWKSKRIVLFDTLLNLTHEEILSVLAHELGHWYHNHLVKSMAASSAHLFIIMYAYGVFVQRYGVQLMSDFGFPTMPDGSVPVMVALMLFGRLWQPIDQAISVLMTVQTRTFEFQADRFSVNDGRSADLKTALIKLQKDNLGDMDPDRLYAWVKYTHPAIVERLRGIDEAEEAYEKKGGKPAAIFETSKDREDAVLVEKEDVPADAGLRELFDKLSKLGESSSSRLLLKSAVPSRTSVFDVDACLEKAKKCELLSAPQIRVLCERLKDILEEESNVLQLQPPVTVVGDVHGQFHDVIELLTVGGPVPDVNYLFLGDYVDRGSLSVETITLLCCMKLRYPDRVTLLRGNHESRQITQVYGFYAECSLKYDDDQSVWKSFTDMFDYLPVAAVIGGRTLAVHGGLSPSVHTLDQLRLLYRFSEIPHEGPLADIVWSDPDGSSMHVQSNSSGPVVVEKPNSSVRRYKEVPPGSGFTVSPRGAGYVFGHDVTIKFLHMNGLDHMVRAHQLCMHGYQLLFPDRCVSTVWSAPNYCYRFGNTASVMEICEDGSRRFNIFGPAPESARGEAESETVLESIAADLGCLEVGTEACVKAIAGYSEDDDGHLLQARGERQVTQQVAHLYDESSEADKQHCAVGRTADGLVTYIVRDMTNATSGFFLDVSLNDCIVRRFKGGENVFSIEGQKNASKEQKATARVPTLQRHLMKEISGIPPWEREMLRRAKGDWNIIPFPTKLSFPTTARPNLKYFDIPHQGCEYVHLQMLKIDLPDRKTRLVQWVTWVTLDTPVPGEGFRVSRLSTSLDRYIPEMKLEFSQDRLRELEGGADRVIPDPTRLSDERYMIQLCKKQFRNYAKYIAQKEGIPEADLEWNDNVSGGIVMWLLTGKVHPMKPDNLNHESLPYSCITYQDNYEVQGDWVDLMQEFFSFTGRIIKNPVLRRNY
ncbi:CAAX prenyl protease 1 [Perkinsus olseni]|uniref:Serine/threonine-protein phosphatase n=1 Tax=Perkinsus olseni TaxID=32597 RepID=A0A7J6PIX3_PEROL|nr:CAAX prenyl protease 1 [Perkinsus olseni]